MMENQAKILIVDDDEGVCAAFQDVFKEKNYTVKTVNSYNEATEAMKLAVYDCILIDLSLEANGTKPEGIHLFVYAKDYFPDMKRIMISASLSEVVKIQIQDSCHYAHMKSEIMRSYVYKEIGNPEKTVNNIIEKLNSSENWWGNYHALLIAVQKYTHHPSPRNLDYPQRDIEALEKTLREHYFFDKIELLYDPTRADIIRTLDRLSKELEKQKGIQKDNLLVFYAGHGCKDDKNNQGYWMPSDFCEAEPETWLSHADVRDWIARIDTQHTLLISDSCFSATLGELRSSGKMAKLSCQEKYEYPSRKFMASGNKTVLDDSEFLKQILTYLENNKSKYLCAETMYKEAIEGKLTTTPDYNTLRGAYIVKSDTSTSKDNNSTDSTNNLKNSNLPQIDEGDFIFIRKY